MSRSEIYADAAIAAMFIAIIIVGLGWVVFGREPASTTQVQELQRQVRDDNARWLAVPSGASQLRLSTDVSSPQPVVLSVTNDNYVRAACVTYSRCQQGYEEAVRQETATRIGNMIVPTRDGDYVCRKSRKP